MKTYNDIDDILRETNNGEMTIIPASQLDVDNIRRHHFEIFSKLNVFWFKPKNGIHIAFIKADDIETYIVLIRMVQKYQVLGPKGQLLSPIPAAA